MMITILTKSKSWSDEHKWTKSREKLNDHQNSKKTIMKDQDYCFFVIITLLQNQKISGILFGQAHLSLWYCVFGEWKISSFGWSLCLVNDKAGPYFYEIDQNFFFEKKDKHYYIIIDQIAKESLQRECLILSKFFYALLLQISNFFKE